MTSLAITYRKAIRFEVESWKVKQKNPEAPGLDTKIYFVPIVNILLLYREDVTKT